MLQNWIKPLSEDQYNKFSSDEPSLFEYTTFFKPTDKIDHHSVALLGLNEIASMKIRNQLYQFMPLSNKIDFIDLGLARNQSEEFLTSILAELSQSKITPIIFGTKGCILNAQIVSNREIPSPRSIAIIDSAPERPEILEKNIQLADKITLIGTQKHIFNRKHWDCPVDVQLFRLGVLKEDILEAEPPLRDCQAISFSLQAVNKREAPAQRNLSNTKLSAYEACQLMHYAGFNPDLRSLAFTHYVPELDMQDITAHLIAQMIWYYLDARSMSTKDLPDQKENVQEFSVVMDQFGFHISFVKSMHSGKWWIRTSDGQYVSCTEKDYRLARQNTLSARVFQLFS